MRIGADLCCSSKRSCVHGADGLPGSVTNLAPRGFGTRRNVALARAVGEITLPRAGFEAQPPRFEVGGVGRCLWLTGEDEAEVVGDDEGEECVGVGGEGVDGKLRGGGTGTEVVAVAAVLAVVALVVEIAGAGSRATLCGGTARSGKTVGERTRGDNRGSGGVADAGGGGACCVGGGGKSSVSTERGMLGAMGCGLLTSSGWLILATAVEVVAVVAVVAVLAAFQ